MYACVRVSYAWQESRNFSRLVFLLTEKCCRIIVQVTPIHLLWMGEAILIRLLGRRAPSFYLFLATKAIISSLNCIFMNLLRCLVPTLILLSCYACYAMQIKRKWTVLFTAGTLLSELLSSQPRSCKVIFQASGLARGATRYTCSLPSSIGKILYFVGPTNMGHNSCFPSF